MTSNLGCLDVALGPLAAAGIDDIRVQRAERPGQCVDRIVEEPVALDLFADRLQVEGRVDSNGQCGRMPVAADLARAGQGLLGQLVGGVQIVLAHQIRGQTGRRTQRVRVPFAEQAGEPVEGLAVEFAGPPVIAFMAVADVWRRLRDRPEHRDRASERFAHIRNQLRFAMGELLRSRELTAAGERLVLTMRGELVGMLAEP